MIQIVIKAFLVRYKFRATFTKYHSLKRTIQNVSGTFYTKES